MCNLGISRNSRHLCHQDESITFVILQQVQYSRDWDCGIRRYELSGQTLGRKYSWSILDINATKELSRRVICLDRYPTILWKVEVVRYFPSSSIKEEA